MDKKVNYIPDDYHSVTPILVLRDAADAIEFYQQAFDAEVLFRQDRPDGKVMHAAIQIGDSVLMLGEECEPHESHERDCVRSPADLKGTTITLYLYVRESDKIFDQAVHAGGETIMPMTDTFWGDRMGMIRDPYGHCWAVATHKEDLSPEQMKERTAEFLSGQVQH